MAHNMPYIVSDFEIYNEYTIRAKTGITAKSADINERTENIILLFDDRSRMETFGNNGFRMIKTKWNWQNEEGKLLEFYSRI